jgi:hypothetical protein
MGRYRGSGAVGARALGYAAQTPTKVAAKPAAANEEKPGKVMSRSLGAGEATGRGCDGGPAVRSARALRSRRSCRFRHGQEGRRLAAEADAVAGAKKLEAENAPYREANPASEHRRGGCRLHRESDQQGHPRRRCASTLVAAGAKGAAQGAALNALTSPVTNDGNFLWEKLKQGGPGAVGGAGRRVGHGLGKRSTRPSSSSSAAETRSRQANGPPPKASWEGARRPGCRRSGEG